MEVQESTNADQSSEDISDYYIKRRTIDTQEPKYLTVDNIKLTEDNEIAIKSNLNGIKIAIIIGKDIPFKENLRNQHDINYFFNNIISPHHEYNKEQIIGSEFKSYISDDLTKIGIKNDEFLYDIKLQDDIEFKPFSDDIFRNINLWNSYIAMKVNRNPWIHDIKKISSIGNNGKFNLIIEPITDYALEWNLDIPVQSDITINPLAQLIENEGSGDPRNLEDIGEVVVMHTSDVPEDIDIIGLDTTEEWVLITKKQFEYIEYESLPSLPSVMDTIDYFGNATLMGLMSIALSLNFIQIYGQPGLQPYYAPTLILLAASLTLTIFLFASSMKRPKSTVMKYVSQIRKYKL